jgi:sensor domain CHASE-containing protein
MDQGIVLIAALVASIIVGCVVWLALRRNLPPEAAAALAAYVAAIRAQLAGVVDEDMIRTLAGAVWDRWGDGGKYFTREQFIEYVLAALYIEPEAQYVIAASATPGFVPRATNLRITTGHEAG